MQSDLDICEEKKVHKWLVVSLKSFVVFIFDKDVLI